MCINVEESLYSLLHHILNKALKIGYSFGDPVDKTFYHENLNLTAAPTAKKK